MLPLQQAYEVQHSILEYLKVTFSFKYKTVHEAFYKFVSDTEDGIFKEPYVSLKLPFVKATDDELIHCKKHYCANLRFAIGRCGDDF